MRQAESEGVAALIDEDPEMIVAWTTSLECASALARLRRQDRIDSAVEPAVLAVLRELGEEWAEVMPVEHVRLTAFRLLRTHPLRAADALQLAAALAWSPHPRGDMFVTFDARLAAAATLEGLTTLPLRCDVEPAISRARRDTVCGSNR